MNNIEFTDRLKFAKELLDLCYKDQTQMSFEEFNALYENNKNNIDFDLSDRILDSMWTKITYFNFFLIGNVMRYYGLMSRGYPQHPANHKQKQSHLRIVK